MFTTTFGAQHAFKAITGVYLGTLFWNLVFDAKTEFETTWLMQVDILSSHYFNVLTLVVFIWWYLHSSVITPAEKIQ